MPILKILLVFRFDCIELMLQIIMRIGLQEYFIKNLMYFSISVQYFIYPAVYKIEL